MTAFAAHLNRRTLGGPRITDSEDGFSFLRNIGRIQQLKTMVFWENFLSVEIFLEWKWALTKWTICIID
jgi:hypothetical protein